jgi:hypothetical protein
MIAKTNEIYTDANGNKVVEPIFSSIGGGIGGRVDIKK